MLNPLSPPGRPQPSIRSSTSAGSSCGTLSSAARTMAAVRSSGRRSFSDPLNARPIGDRAVATITASAMSLSVPLRPRDRHELPAVAGRPVRPVDHLRASIPLGYLTEPAPPGAHRRWLARQPRGESAVAAHNVVTVPIAGVRGTGRVAWIMGGDLAARSGCRWSREQSAQLSPVPPDNGSPGSQRYVRS